MVSYAFDPYKSSDKSVIERERDEKFNFFFRKKKEIIRHHHTTTPHHTTHTSTPTHHIKMSAANAGPDMISMIALRKTTRGRDTAFFKRTVEMVKDAELGEKEFWVTLKDALEMARKDQFSGEVEEYIQEYRASLKHEEAKKAKVLEVAEKKRSETAKRSKVVDKKKSESTKKSKSSKYNSPADDYPTDEDDGVNFDLDEEEEDWSGDDEDDDEDSYYEEPRRIKKTGQKRARDEDRLEYDNRLKISEKDWDELEDDSIKRAYLNALQRREKNVESRGRQYDESTWDNNPQNALLESNWKSPDHAKEFAEKLFERWVSNRSFLLQPGAKEDMFHQLKDLKLAIQTLKSDCFGENKKRNFNYEDEAACLRFDVLARATMAYMIRLEFQHYTRAGAAKVVDEMYDAITLDREEMYKPGRLRMEFTKMKAKLKKDRVSGSSHHESSYHGRGNGNSRRYRAGRHHGGGGRGFHGANNTTSASNNNTKTAAKNA